MAKRLFIGNLSWGATEEDVRDLFKPYGTVSSVNILMDRETGKSRGFGFVEVENSNEAMQALNGTNFMGRNIAVNEARERQSNGGGGERRW